MIWVTHLAFGFLAALVMKNVVNTGNIYIFFSLVLIGALMPDIDQPDSKINQKLRLTKVFTVFFRHRGLFHSLFFAVLLPGLVYLFIGKPYGTALFIGYLSHLLIDGLTIAGVDLLHPLAKFRISGFVETGRMTETITFIVILAIIVLKLV